MDSLIINNAKVFESFINRFIKISEKYDICKNKLNIVGTNIDETKKEMTNLEQQVLQIYTNIRFHYGNLTFRDIKLDSLLKHKNSVIHDLFRNPQNLSILNSYHYYRINELEKKMKKIEDYESRIEILETHIDDTDDLQIAISDLESKYDLLEEENKNLKNEISDLKNLLMEKNIIDKPVPNYDYNDIANRILPFKKELMTVTKWINKNTLPVAVPVKYI